jgi:antitoxin (DNA-binding transcriptional repressor) of toxin-antitoxin stability system
LKEVRAGGEIIVCDRERAIAKIVPLTVDDESAAEVALVAAGLMRKADRPVAFVLEDPARHGDRPDSGRRRQ